jgi:hypothetical protein
MEKLISMTDFVLEQVKILIHGKDPANIKKYDYVLRTTAYAKFLKQPLELWMFVPCGEDGNVLEEKSIFNTTDEDYIFDSESFNKYQQAKERCLFDGFEHIKDDYKSIFSRIRWEGNREILIQYFKEMNIENLIRHNLTLTPAALKQIGL